jgi:alpha-L-fucosidase
MQWFRDAKFGMFIHWGPCAIGEREIGWGRNARRPMDIGIPDPSDDRHDAEYDQYYKVFNPVKYDPDAWVRFAMESGMKYMVLITKHHDGFSMFDTKLSDYNIMNTPYGKDIVKGFVDACHKYGMKCGLYYSTRDWYHPDYLVGDNRAYDEWYMGQVEELLTNYGKIDIMWYDHVGGRNWSLWRFDKLFDMMYRLQPDLIVNNRAARFCGKATPEDQGPSSPEYEKMTFGDYDTPEGRIGSMNIGYDWESCIHCGKGWSYRGEDGFKGPEECIRMLVSCVTGGGNLLLNFGPRPDGTFTDGEILVAQATGEFLAQYGEAIYGTRGGPYKNGPWGGSCHKDRKLYLFIYEWSNHGPLKFDPLPIKVLEARTLDGAAVSVEQDGHELRVSVAREHQVTPVTVIALTLEKAIEPGTLYGVARMITTSMTEYGHILSENASMAMSSMSVKYNHLEDREKLFRGERSSRGYAVHTEPEENPWMFINLHEVRTIKAVIIENRPGERRTEGLILSISTDGKAWEQVWQAEAWEEKWLAVVTHFHAGIDVPGRKAQFLKFETRGETPRPLALQRVTVYGD